ncbi:uncharacterized protein LOC127080471 [Lathyrus oleraceus]|uniref:uncharacterized protein LOC127080471 n=1 Tax=Pisum sativum TaxID=3888 RepID=UPI0021D2E7ED|nr:uncharacterized protein LOC127080471 [Pisum sativum]
MAHQSDTTSYTTVSDSHSTEFGNPNREEVGVNAATSSHARRPKETVSRNSSAIALDKPSKEGSRVSVPLTTIIPDDGACRETAVVLRENVSGLPEEGPKNDKPVSKVRGEKVSVTQAVDANPRADTVNLEEFSDNELLASVIPSIAKRVMTRREKKTVVQKSPTKEVDETTSPKQTVTESARKRKGHGPAKPWSKEVPKKLKTKVVVVESDSDVPCDVTTSLSRKKPTSSKLAASVPEGKHVPDIVMTSEEASKASNQPDKAAVIAVLRETCKELESRKLALEKLIFQLETSAEDTNEAARQSSEDEEEASSEEEADDEAEE